MSRPAQAVSPFLATVFVHFPPVALTWLQMPRLTVVLLAIVLVLVALHQRLEPQLLHQLSVIQISDQLMKP